MTDRVRTARGGRAVVAAFLLATALAAQERTPAWRIDPYTRNEPELMARLGYLSYGPFEFGRRGSKPATTEDIDAATAPAEVLWVETAHFKIGTSLEAYSPSDRAEKLKIRAELEELRELLPTFNPRTRTLDPWLRLHLTAKRVERFYDEFSARLGVTDADFPESPDRVIAGQGRFMGYGPYFGMQSKYLLFVTTPTGPHKAYMRNFIGKVYDTPQRWHFKDIGALLYAVSTDGEDGRLRRDTALHANLVFNVAHGLIDGFRHYSYDLPVWITEGLAHWFERRIDPRWNSFSFGEGGHRPTQTTWRWDQVTLRLISTDKGTPFAELYTWRDFADLDFDDHVLTWSRWDFLMSQGDEKLAEFLFTVKGRIDPETWHTDQSDLVGASREALWEAYGLTPLTFDERWKEWVASSY